MPKTTFSQKIALILFGFALAAMLLEAGLRVAEKVYLAAQDQRNQKTGTLSSHGAGKTTKILCLGESTTAFGGQDSYPSQLARRLNERSARQFTVINKGVPATTTDQIVRNLEKYLEQYQPDIVVTMIGVNDAATTPAYKDLGDAAQSRTGFEFKVVKLFRMLRAHLQQRQKEIKEELGNKKILEAAQKELKDNPQSYHVYIQMAQYYEKAEDFGKAEEQYLSALQLPAAPGLVKLALISGLAGCYSEERKYSQAEMIYRNLIKNIPGRDDKILFYDLLTELYMDDKKFPEAVDTFLQRIALKPTGIAMYMKISYAYRELGRFDELEKVLRRGLTLHPPDTEHYLFLYSELGYCLIENKKYPEAKTVFQEMLAMNSKQKDEARIDIQYGLELAEKGIRGEAAVVDRGPYSSDKAYYFPATIDNYCQLKDAVIRHGIKLIAVQYPMRPVAPLKRALNADPRIIFVDNESVFKKSVAEAGYSKYFVDHFGGDFGHCTVKGNALLAEQVAGAVLEAIR